MLTSQLIDLHAYIIFREEVSSVLYMCTYTNIISVCVCVCLCVCMESVGVSLSKDYVFWHLLVMTPGQYLYVFANTGKSQQSTIGIMWSSLDSTSVKLTWCLQPMRSYIFLQHKLYFSMRVLCAILQIWIFW